MPDLIRSFLAIELSEQIRASLEDLVERLKRRPAGHRLRWVKPENLHVTLHFLGDIPRASLAELGAGVAGELASSRPFDCRLEGLHLFPTARRPRVVAVGLASDGQLEDLAAAVGRGVVAAGFPAADRPFRGHLTLGRIRDRSRPELDGVLLEEELPMRIDKVVLMQSELRPSGPVYTRLAEFLLCPVPGPGATPDP